MHTMIVLVLQAAVGALRLDGDNSPLTTCMAFVLSYPGAKYLSKFSPHEIVASHHPIPRLRAYIEEA